MYSLSDQKSCCGISREQVFIIEKTFVVQSKKEVLEMQCREKMIYIP